MRMYPSELFDWTDERVALLKKLWADGWSQTQIGIRFGVSASSISGKIKRLKLTRRENAQSKAKAQGGKLQGKANAPCKAKPRQAAAQPKTVTPKFDYRTPPTSAPTPKPAPFLKRLPVSIPPAPKPELVNVAALTSAICHWPVEYTDEHGWLYCGAHRNPHSKAYCTHHQARMIDDASRQRFLSRRA